MFSMACDVIKFGRNFCYVMLCYVVDRVLLKIGLLVAKRTYVK